MACSEPVSSQPSATMKGANVRPAVLLFELAEQAIFNASAPVASALFNEYVLTGAEFETLGPYMQDLIVHAEGSNFSANFSYQIVLQYRYGNGAWLAGGTAVPLQTSGTYVVGTAMTDRTKFGRRIRLVLQTQIVAGGTTNSQTGTMNISAATRLFT